MRFGFIGSRPLHLVSLFIIFPFTHFFFSSFLSCLSCPVISPLSFFCAHISPGLSLYAHICCTFRFQLAQVLIMRFVHLLPLCIWFPFHCNHTHTLLFRLSSLSCLHPLVHAAHTMHTCSSFMFCLLSGRCVCVCVTPCI